MAGRPRFTLHVLFVTTVFVLAAFSAPTSADHAQETPAGTVTFDHRGGNEWWIEAVVTHAGSRPDAVHARDEGDTAWHALEWKSWGEWAGSFHIEPGHRVMFRSTDNAMGAAQSCWFTHPAGAEECESAPPPPPPPGEFEATFDTPGGNQWWVEVYVDASEPLAGVDARANGGAWHDLTKRSWGAWAGSFHVPDGSLVEFRARSTGGDTTLSGEYRWPSGEPVGTNPDPEPEPPGSLDAAFAPKASNAWWVEALVLSNTTITNVEARTNGGTWHQLTLRSWGSWAASFHAPSGSTVEFRATDDEGATGTSVGFVWPGAVPVTEAGTPWPHEGGYARYVVSTSSPGGFNSQGVSTFVHHHGAWRVWCVGEEGLEGDKQPFARYADEAPPTNPTAVAPDQRVEVQRGACGRITDEVIVRHTESEQTRRDGDAVTVATWYGQRIDDCECIEYESEWEKETGLVTDWHMAGRGSSVGDLEDTDAPIGG